jgi:tryptophan-rich sensory protein
MHHADHPTAHRLSLPIAALLAAIPVLAAATIGNFATMPNISPWYESLAKPPFNPPNWVFGPVWGTLYALMIVSFTRILRVPSDAPGRGVAIAAFLTQMFFNALWSVAFFAAHSPAAGPVVIAALIVSLGATIRAFHRFDRPAAWLLVPYAAWVSFAAILNFSVWWLN